MANLARFGLIGFPTDVAEKGRRVANFWCPWVHLGHMRVKPVAPTDLIANEALHSIWVSVDVVLELVVVRERSWAVFDRAGDVSLGCWHGDESSTTL